MVCCRGLPGSGKSTVARTLAPVVTEADQFFVRPDGSYGFNPALLGRAHAERNLHGVPVEGIRKMRAKWQPCTPFPGVTK